MLRTFGDGLRLVASHPTILATAVPLLAWDWLTVAFDIPRADSVDLAAWRAHAAQLPCTLVLEPAAAGLAIAFADRAARSRASWREAVPPSLRALPSLVAVAAMLLVSALVAGTVAVPLGLGVPIVLTVTILWMRLAFVQTALVVDHLGIRGAVERSWSITRGNWWRVAALLALPATVVAAASWLVSPAGLERMDILLAPALQAIFVVAYGRLLGSDAVVDPAVPLASPTVEPV